MTQLVTEKTSKGLVNAMFEELDALRNKNSTPQMARAKSSIANTIIAVSRLEMEYERFVASAKDTKEEGMRCLTMG